MNIVRVNGFSSPLKGGKIVYIPRIIAVDCGNFNVKSKSSRGELQYCNSIREKSRFEDEYVFGSDNIKTKTYRLEGKEYVVGSTDPKSRFILDKNKDRYGAPDFKLSFIIAVYKHIQFNGEVVRVVTGLPSDHYQNESNYQKIREDFNSLEGTHTVNNTTFTIEEIELKLQPVATLNYLAMNEDGTFKKGGEMYKKSRILILDLGMGSTDVTIINNGKYEDMYEINYTMYNVYEDILKQTIGLPGENDNPNELIAENPTPQEMEVQIRESLEGEEKKAIFTSGTGKVFEIDNIVKGSFELAANNILSGLTSRGVVFSTYYAVVFTGGGAKTLLPYLKERLREHKGDSNIRFKMPDDLIRANVRGYYVAAQANKLKVKH